MVEVRLIGGLELRARGRTLPAPAHEQAPALLAWLALHPGDHHRGALAAVLWPQLRESAARLELRRAAWSLRRSLGRFERALLDRPDTLGLSCDSDLRALARLAAAGELDAALALCRGRLLADLPAHDWVLRARAEHEQRVAALRAARERAPVASPGTGGRHGRQPRVALPPAQGPRAAATGLLGVAGIAPTPSG